MPFDAATVAHFQVHGAADNVARGQVFHCGGVGFHEALALVVEQHTAFAAHAFGDQDAHFVDAGGVELEEFHVLERNAAPIDDRGAIAGVGICVGSDLPHAAMPAGGEDNGFGMEGVQFAGGQFHCYHASQFCRLRNKQIKHLELVVELDLVLKTLLVQGLQDHVTGAVSGMGCAANGFAGIVIGVPAKRSL